MDKTTLVKSKSYSITNSSFFPTSLNKKEIIII